MFKNLTYKQKNKALLIGAILLLLMVYFLGVKKTYLAWSGCREMEAKLSQAKDMPLKVAELRKRMADMDNLLASRKDTSVKTQDLILSLVTRYCQNNGTVLKEFPKTIQTQEKEFLVETNILTAQGDFASLLNLLFIIEQKDKLGRIASVDFHMKKDPETKVQQLLTTLFIQNIKKIASNEK